MRIAVGCFWQETNSFNPVPTRLEDFAAFGLYRGDEMLERLEGANEVGGVLDAVRAAAGPVELVPLLRAWGSVGGPLTAAAHQALAGEVCERIARAGALDGVVLALHGACVAEDVDDVEGALLRDVRTLVGPRVPIIVSLDHHANVTPLMVASADALIGHRTEPHDPHETAGLATHLLLRTLAGEVSPTLGWRKLPLITHQERFLTAEGPMREWFEHARDAERRPGVLSVSPFPMQPWLDVRDGGWAVVAVTDGDPLAAERIATELAEHAWSLRDEFLVKTSLPVAEAVREGPRHRRARRHLGHG